MVDISKDGVWKSICNNKDFLTKTVVPWRRREYVMLLSFEY